MQQADFARFKAALVGVYELYGKPLSPALIDIWWTALKPYDVAAVLDGLGRHCVNPDSGQFLPKPADVVRMLSGGTQDAALVAWAKVDRSLRTVGPYRDVVFDDPLIHRVIADMGGWISFGTKTDDDWPFVAKEFENRYRGYRSRSEVPAFPPRLTGIASHENGVALEAPMLIGDQAACLRVLEGGTTTPLLPVRQAEFIPQAAGPLRLVSSKERA